MYSLIFDTSSFCCQVGLLKNDKIIADFIKPMDFGQAEVLLPEIKNLLDKHGLKIKDLKFISVCAGPGSFTGIRSSLSAARAFGIACPEVKLIGVSSFDSYLYSLAAEEVAERNAVIIETKREDFYVQIFDKDFNKTTDAKAMLREEIIKELKPAKKVTLIGDGVERFLSSPSGLSLHQLKMLPFPPLEGLKLCSLHKYKNKQFEYPKPIYLKSPDISC